MATWKQIKKIHAAVRDLGMSREDYENNLREYGVGHSNDPNFTNEMASDFIKKLNRCALTGSSKGADKQQSALPPSKYRGTGKQGYNLHITQPRADRIGILEDLLGWNEKRTQGFIFKQTGFNKSVEMLTSHEGSKVIIGMTRFYANGNHDTYLRITRLTNIELQNLINGNNKINSGS